jgi:hypothetical protein
MTSLKLSPELVQKLDQIEPSPTVNFDLVFASLKEHCSNITDYQLLCFCIIYLTGIAAKEKMFEGPARQLNRDLHFAHYDTILKTIKDER